MQDRRSYFPLPLREKVLTECLRNAGGMQGCLVSPEPSPLAGEGSDWHMRKSGRKTAERHDDASPPQGNSNRGTRKVRIYSSAAVSLGAAIMASATRPAFERIARSMASPIAGLSLRKLLAVSRPWPMRWPA